MKSLVRGFRFLGHLALSALSLAWFAGARRGAALVFSHEPDLEPDGADPQMGPLVEGLLARGRCVTEVTFVSLDGGLWRNLRAKRRPFVSYAVLVAGAELLRALGLRREEARRAMGRALLGSLGTKCLYAIDESGSGQLLVQAARRRGIRTIGIQHGDFQPTNPQYSRTALAEKTIEPVDVLCLWSPWFRERLLQVSPIYDATNTCVTGRLRFFLQGRPAAAARSDRPKVLLMSEARVGFLEDVRPFVEALSETGDFDVLSRPHPADPPGRWGSMPLASGRLQEVLQGVDVVVGIGSSALLEALWAERPIVVLVHGPDPDPSGYAREGIGIACSAPSELPRICRECLRPPGEEFRRARERVWGGSPPFVFESVLACERDPSTSGS